MVVAILRTHSPTFRNMECTLSVTDEEQEEEEEQQEQGNISPLKYRIMKCIMPQRKKWGHVPSWLAKKSNQTQ